jgi:hypothetical protein
MKYHLTLLFLITFSFLNKVTAQDCIPAGIIFTTQQQIDNFPTSYPSCTQINGDLRIEERVANNITNLDGLAQITSIKGNLLVTTNPALTTLKGLNNLTSVGGQLVISSNPSLKNISDLDNLIFINENLIINRNASLLNLNGFNNLTFIGGLLRVKENDSLTNLNGLNQVTSIDKDFWVQKNNNLKNLSGLENMISIKGNLLISFNKSLINVDGLKNLTSIGKSIKIHKNASLTSLSGLDNVTSIGENMYISDNVSLTNQKELENLSSVSEKKVSRNGQITQVNKNKYYKTWVTLKDNSSKIKGYLSEVGDSMIIISNFSNNERQVILLKNVKAIKFRKNGTIGRGILLGALTGAAIGVVTGFAAGDDKDCGFLTNLCFTAKQKARGRGILFTIPGALLGGIAATSKINIPINGNTKNRKKELLKYKF